MFLIRNGLMFVSFFPVIQWLSVFSFMFQPCAYNAVLFCPNLVFHKSGRRTRMYYCISSSSSIQGKSQLSNVELVVSMEKTSLVA